ncbi:MAG: hypothetical protein DRI57_22000, partial [Deltaproteobacteria bacterium]
FAPFVFFTALCDIFSWPHTKAQRSQRKALRPLCSLRLCVIFFHGLTQRHKDHRGKLCVFVFFAALCDIFS